jgi:hypothetical protein
MDTTYRESLNRHFIHLVEQLPVDMIANDMKNSGSLDAQQMAELSDCPLVWERRVKLLSLIRDDNLFWTFYVALCEAGRCDLAHMVACEYTVQAAYRWYVSVWHEHEHLPACVVRGEKTFDCWKDCLLDVENQQNVKLCCGMDVKIANEAKPKYKWLIGYYVEKDQPLYYNIGNAFDTTEECLADIETMLHSNTTSCCQYDVRVIKV